MVFMCKYLIHYFSRTGNAYLVKTMKKDLIMFFYLINILLVKG